MKEKAYKLFMILQGVLWLYMATQSIITGKSGLLVFLLMLLDGILFILLALPDIHRRRYSFIALAFLAGNTLLTVTDQMGVMDYLVLVWNIALLILVLSIIVKPKHR